MFTDNDELAGLTASMIGAEKLIILSNVDGVYDDAGHVIGLVPFGDDAHKKHISVEKSGMGRGGMHSKVEIATRAAAGGIETFIANGKQAECYSGCSQRESDGHSFCHKRSKQMKEEILKSLRSTSRQPSAGQPGRCADPGNPE